MKDLASFLLRDDIPEDVKQIIQQFHSKQKKEQKQLLRESDFLSLIPEVSPVAIAVLDRSGKIIFINSQGVKTLGIPKERIIGIDINDPKWAFTDFDGQPLLSENLPFNIVKKTLQPVFNVEHAVLGENGVPIYLSINAAPLFDEEGVFNGVVISIENQTERINVEKETSTLTEFSNLVLDQAPIGICTFNNDYIVTSFNKYFEDLTGFKKANIIGRNLFEAIPSIIEGGWENMYRKVIETGEPYIIDNYQYKVRYGPHKGKTMYSSNKIVPLTLKGKIGGAIVIYEDISEQILVEEEKKKAKKAKLELEERRDKFIWMASHELRTPMTVIRGYMDFLQKHFDNINLKSREKIFRILTNNMSRLERLSNQVSELGQVEYGTFQLNKTQIEICNFLDQCIEPYRLLYGHQIRYRGCKGLTVNYEGDPDRLQQVIDNIMENAIKQTSKEHREIFISLESLPDKIIIRITDNGVGIAPENLETIFEQFRSIPTDYIATGTGIGLFLSRRIIEDHGGEITAQSEGTGQGATFTIELPK